MIPDAIQIISPDPSKEFKSFLMAEYPRRIGPLVAMWLNEIHVLAYAKEIETGFEGVWLRSPASLISPLGGGSTWNEHPTSHDVALSPTDFVPAEQYVVIEGSHERVDEPEFADQFYFCKVFSQDSQSQETQVSLTLCSLIRPVYSFRSSMGKRTK